MTLTCTCLRLRTHWRYCDPATHSQEMRLVWRNETDPTCACAVSDRQAIDPMRVQAVQTRGEKDPTMQKLITQLNSPERRTGVPRRLTYNRKPDFSILDRRVKATRRRYIYMKRNVTLARASFGLSLVGIVVSWVFFISEVTK